MTLKECKCCGQCCTDIYTTIEVPLQRFKDFVLAHSCNQQLEFHKLKKVSGEVTKTGHLRIVLDKLSCNALITEGPRKGMCSMHSSRPKTCRDFPKDGDAVMPGCVYEPK